MRGFCDHLRAGLEALSLPTLSSTAEAGLEKYLELLLFWNRRINLTAVRDEEGIVSRHFVDSLAVLPHLPSDLGSLVDAGAGAGFPGAVLALARPDVAVALVESNQKKAAFLLALKRELPLPNVEVHARRIEDYLAIREGAADAAVSRATWDLLDWLPIGRRLVRRGGLVLGMEGTALHDLPPGARRHPYRLAGLEMAVVSWVNADDASQAPDE